MSDHVGVNLGANRPVEPFQSVWTVHQTQMSRREPRGVDNGHSYRLESQNDHVANKHSSIDILEEDANLSDSMDFAEVTEARTVRIMKRGVMASSETLTHERFGRQRLSAFNILQNFKVGDRKNELNLSSRGQVARSPVDWNSEYTMSKVSHPPPKCPGNNNEVVLYDSLAQAGPSRDKFTASNMAHLINVERLPALCSVGKRKTHTQLGSGVESKEDIPSGNFTVLGHENHTYRSSTFSVPRERRVDQNYTPFPLHDPFCGNSNSLEDDEEQYQKIHGFSGNGTSTSQSHHLEPIIPEKLHAKSYSSRKVPHSIQEEGNSSKTSHAFWESTNPANVDRIMPTKRLAFASGIGQRGVQFHPSGIVTDRAEYDRNNLKSESSADTDTMDIGDLKEQSDFSGIKSSPSNKMAMNPPSSQVEKASVGEATKCRRAINTLPDINEEIPFHQSALGLTNDATTVSTSRTLSLDADHLIQPHQKMKRKSHDSSSTPLEIDPSSRWLKRLRSVASSDWPNVAETSSQKEVDKEVLSETWIKRWYCNQATPPKVVTTSREPQSSSNKEESDKQFPSFAAMALMGRAMTGFRPCEFQSRGPLVVWNTNNDLRTGN